MRFEVAVWKKGGKNHYRPFYIYVDDIESNNTLYGKKLHKIDGTQQLACRLRSERPNHLIVIADTPDGTIFFEFTSLDRLPGKRYRIQGWKSNDGTYTSWICTLTNPRS